MSKTLVEPINKNEPSGKNIRNTEAFINLKDAYHKLYFHIEDNTLSKDTKTLISYIHNTCETIVITQCKDLELFKFLITTYTIYKQSRGYVFIIQQLHLLISNLWDSFFPCPQEEMYINKRISILCDIDKTYRYLNEFTIVTTQKPYKLIDILRHKRHPKISNLFVQHVSALKTLLEEIYNIYYTIIEIEKLINTYIDEYNKNTADDDIVDTFEFVNIKQNCNQLCSLFESILQKITLQSNEVKNNAQESETQKTPQKTPQTTNEDPQAIIHNINKAIDMLNTHKQYTVLYKTLKYCTTHMNYTDSEMANQMVHNDKLVLMLKLVLNKT